MVPATSRDSRSSAGSFVQSSQTFPASQSQEKMAENLASKNENENDSIFALNQYEKAYAHDVVVSTI